MRIYLVVLIMLFRAVLPFHKYAKRCISTGVLGRVYNPNKVKAVIANDESVNAKIVDTENKDGKKTRRNVDSDGNITSDNGNKKDIKSKNGINNSGNKSNKGSKRGLNDSKTSKNTSKDDRNESLIPRKDSVILDDIFESLIVYEDNHVIVITKPASALSQSDKTFNSNNIYVRLLILTHAHSLTHTLTYLHLFTHSLTYLFTYLLTYSLQDATKRYLLKSTESKDVYVGLINRLDRPVSGLQLLGKTKVAAQILSKEFQNRQNIDKYYVGTYTHSLTHLLTYSLTHLLTHLLTYLLIHLLTHLLTHSLTLTLSSCSEWCCIIKVK